MNLVFRLTTLFVPVGLAVLSTLARGQSAELPVSADFHIGDRWEWKRFDNLTGQSGGGSVRSVVAEGASAVLLNDGFGYQGRRSTVIAAFTNGTYDESSKPWRAWPLAVGKKWTLDADWRRPDGVTGHTKQDFEVLAFEEVVVPAGRFMAYKIYGTGFFGSSNVTTARQVDTYWYAPEAKADVKHLREESGGYTDELVVYRRWPTVEAAGSTPAPTNLSSMPVASGRAYLDTEQLSNRIVGEPKQLRRLADGAERIVTFRPDRTASIQAPGGRRGRSGNWDLSNGRMCIHVGEDSICFQFFDEAGVLKSGPPDGDARWEVQGIP